jgi:hypothetical protein
MERVPPISLAEPALPLRGMQVTGPIQARVRHHLRLRAKPAMLVELWSFDPRAKARRMSVTAQKAYGLRCKLITQLEFNEAAPRSTPLAPLRF